MTLEEMIEAVQYTCACTSPSATDKIIAALKAGQALAAAADQTERLFCRLHHDAHGTEAVPFEFAGVSRALRAYRKLGGADE